MLLTGFSHDDDLTYECADEVPTAFIRQNTASYGAVAWDAGIAAGDDVGRWSGASSFICDTGILGRCFAGTGGSVCWFLKQARPLLLTLRTV